MKRRIASHYALIDGRIERDILVQVDSDGTITQIRHCDNIDREPFISRNTEKDTIRFREISTKAKTMA